MSNFEWKIFWVNLDPVRGSEQAGRRPVLVVSTDDSNDFLPNVTVLPITSYKGGTVYPNETFLKAGTAGLPADSVVLAHQIRTISKDRLGDKTGEITDQAIKDQIHHSVRLHLGL